MPLLEVSKEKGIVTLALNDPARSNLLSSTLCVELIDQVVRASEDPEARTIVIRAKGKAFCAGADLEDLKAASTGDTAAVQNVYQAFLAVAHSRLPTVAVVEGPAVGAGMNLALACDIRIAGEGAMFDPRFLQIGLHPGGGHAWMLLRAVGWQTASRLLLLGATVDAAQAERCGLVAQCVKPDEMESVLQTVLSKVSRTPCELLFRTKQTMRLAVTQDHDAAFGHETEEQMWSLRQPAFTELVAKLQRTLAQR